MARLAGPEGTGKSPLDREIRVILAAGWRILL
jgi:hypothetical protein